MSSVNGKKILLTGASSGIGRALALWLAREGAQVFAAARREEALAALKAESASAKGSVEPVRLDVAETHAAVKAIRALDERCGGLDIVIANAGVGEETPAKRIEWDRVEHLLQVNVMGAAATLTAVLPAMVARKRGQIVGISSLAALMPMARMSAYAASKAFLAHFLDSLRLELAGKGITVTSVLPGFVRSEMTAKNKFKMPFILEADDAAERIGKAIARGETTFAFPFPMATGARAMSLLPEPVLRLLASKTAR